MKVYNLKYYIYKMKEQIIFTKKKKKKNSLKFNANIFSPV